MRYHLTSIKTANIKETNDNKCRHGCGEKEIFVHCWWNCTGTLENNTKERRKWSCSLVSNSLWPRGLLHPWDFPGKNTGVGCHLLLQGIFLTQGTNLGLPHCRQILDLLSQQGSPWILVWVAYPFSEESSWPRNQTGASCIGGGFFTS